MLCPPKPNPTNRYGAAVDVNEALMAAARSPLDDELRVAGCLARLAAVNYKDAEGRTALMEACRCGNAHVAKLLLKRGAMTNLKCNLGDSALVAAARADRRACARVLLHAGINVNMRNNAGNGALMEAVMLRRRAMAKLLMRANAKMNVRNTLGQTALRMATQRGLGAIARLLLVSGADTGTPDNVGYTALMEAAQNDRLAMVRLLLQNGASPNLKTHSQRTALMQACLYGHARVVKLLLQYHVEVNAADARGYTALVESARDGRRALVALLLQRGADVYMATDPGECALDYARQVRRRRSPSSSSSSSSSSSILFFCTRDGPTSAFFVFLLHLLLFPTYSLTHSLSLLLPLSLCDRSIDRSTNDRWTCALAAMAARSHARVPPAGGHRRGQRGARHGPPRHALLGAELRRGARPRAGGEHAAGLGAAPLLRMAHHARGALQHGAPAAAASVRERPQRLPRVRAVRGPGLRPAAARGAR